jgi:transposase
MADYRRETMTIKVRAITAEESKTLNHWQRADDIVGYRRARMLQLSAAGWKSADIAEALGVHVETVRQTIKAFNEGGIPAITPRPRSGGSPAMATAKK